MTAALFVTCPKCERFMLGQRHGEEIYPQPHRCEREAGQ